MLKPESRAAEAASVLRQEALARGPGSRLSSVRELSAKYGFSQASLSSALTQLEQEGVLVRRHGAGIFASTKAPSCHISVAIASPFLLRPNQSPFWNLVLNKLILGVAERGWECTCHVGSVSEKGSWPSHEERLELSAGLMTEVRSRGSKGVISLGLTMEEALAAKEAGATVVSYAGYGQVMLSRDFSSLVDSGLKALSNRGSGPVYVAPCERYSLPLALEGKVRADCPDARLVKFVESESNDRGDQFGHLWSKGLDDPVVAGEEWLHSVAEMVPFRLLSLDDMFTFGVLKGMQELGLELKRDILIATHANRLSPVLTEYEHNLIRLEIDPDEVAVMLLDLVAAATQLGGWDKIAGQRYPAQKLPGGELVYFAGQTAIYPQEDYGSNT